MIRVLYFASLRERLGVASEAIEPPAEVSDVAALRGWLARRGGEWDTLSPGSRIKAAVNQRFAALDTAVRDGDEVAFFPPVTGG